VVLPNSFTNLIDRLRERNSYSSLQPACCPVRSVKPVTDPVEKAMQSSPTKKMERTLGQGQGDPRQKVYFKTLETGEGFSKNRRRVKDQI
jgi:hypothetical protein